MKDHPPQYKYVILNENDAQIKRERDREKKRHKRDTLRKECKRGRKKEEYRNKKYLLK